MQERKRDSETSMCGCLSRFPFWGPGLKPKLCPDCESNWWPFGLPAHAEATELHQPGHLDNFLLASNT